MAMKKIMISTVLMMLSGCMSVQASWFFPSHNGGSNDDAFAAGPEDEVWTAEETNDDNFNFDEVGSDTMGGIQYEDDGYAQGGDFITSGLQDDGAFGGELGSSDEGYSEDATDTTSVSNQTNSNAPGYHGHHSFYDHPEKEETYIDHHPVDWYTATGRKKKKNQEEQHESELEEEEN